MKQKYNPYLAVFTGTLCLMATLALGMRLQEWKLPWIEKAAGATCGNGEIETGEACDDENTSAGDGCSATCTVEVGYSCTEGCPGTVFGDAMTASMRIVWLDATRVLAVYEESGTNVLKASVGTVSGDSLAFGTPNAIGSSNVNSLGLQLVKVDTNKAVVLSVTVDQIFVSLTTLTISGDTVTAGTPGNIAQFNCPLYALEALSATKVVALYGDTFGNLYSVIGDIQPDDSIVLGTPAQITGGNAEAADLAVYSSTQFILIDHGATAPGTVLARTGNVSGNAITYGAAATLSDWVDVTWVSVAIESNYIAFVYYEEITGATSRIAIVGATDLFLFDESVISTPSNPFPLHIKAISGDATYQYIISWRDTGSDSAHSALCARITGDTVLDCDSANADVTYSIADPIGPAIAEPDVYLSNDFVFAHMEGASTWIARLGNADPVHYCRSVCTAPETCGNGAIEGDEGCDDGNVTAGDGCSALCAVETGYSCVGEPSVCTLTCGNGVIDGVEGCDDNNVTASDGCSATCTVESGYGCVGEPSVCTVTCGDGIITDPESCDDSNVTAGDGCSATCRVESGFTCSGTPSSCVTDCGDGVIAGAEECDPPGSATCTDMCLFRTAGGGGGTAATGTAGGTAATAPAAPAAPPKPSAACGNGIVETGEQCDFGNLNELMPCSKQCKELSCGDGIISYKIGEECEPEKVADEYGNMMYMQLPPCSADPQATFCPPPGSGYQECVLTELPLCGREAVEQETIPFARMEEETAYCGNGRKDDAEQCDFGGLCVGGRYDGATWKDRAASLLCRGQGGMSIPRSGDDCSAQCRFEFCGDGLLVGQEQCDNGSYCSGDQRRACRTNDDCAGGSCLYNTEANLFCTKSCILCAGRYEADIDIASVTEGEHPLKVKVTNPCGIVTLAETHFTSLYGLSALREEDPVPGFSHRPPQNSTTEADGSKPFTVTVQMDRKNYLSSVDATARVTITVTDAEGRFVPGLTPDAFVLALDGRKLDSARVTEAQGPECASLPASARAQRSYGCKAETPVTISVP